jgi:hypothetical protein
MQGSIRNSICFFYPNLAVFRICEEVALWSPIRKISRWLISSAILNSRDEPHMHT